MQDALSVWEFRQDPGTIEDVELLPKKGLTEAA
jgi:hypothetical protein